MSQRAVWSVRRLLSMAAALSIAFLQGTIRADVRINEVLAANRLAVADADGDFPDWIEIVNAGEAEVSLDGHFLTDDPTAPDKWRFPDIRLRAGEYAVVWCSGKNRSDTELHANFQLSRAGETVELRAPDGRRIDAIDFPAQTEDHSWGRFPDRTGDWTFLLEPTPGQSNDTLPSAAPIDARPSILPPAGRYDDPVTVAITGRLPAGVTFRFTVDGSPPTAESLVYESPRVVERDRVVRAAGFLDGRRVTQIATQSYFVGPSSLEIPFLSIAMHPDDFILVHTTSDGRGREFEREAHVELFDRNGRNPVTAGSGLRLHGGVGRHGGLEQKKSYRAYFRGVYGDTKLHARLFPDSPVTRFDQLVLRANYSDALRRDRRGSLVRDQVIRDLHRDTGALAAHGTWYNLFINGEYRGIYNVVERIDKSFFAAHVDGTEDADWDVIRPLEGPIDGDATAWNELLTFVRNADLAARETYEEARRRLDVIGFTDYVILNLWAENVDWPAHNWFAARPRWPGSPWRFVCWDAEVTFAFDREEIDPDTLRHFVVSGEGSELVDILLALLENEGYRRLFLERLDALLATALAPANVTARIRAHAQAVAPDVPEDAGITGGDSGAWEGVIAAMLRFPEFRADEIRAFIRESPLFTLSEREAFRRGDANDDGRANISDAVFILRSLPLAQPGAACGDALDVDDSGRVSLTDGVFLLNYLFRDLATPPPPPFAACDTDPTEDELGCEAQASCEDT